jgi:hypothetical protein
MYFLFWAGGHAVGLVPKFCEMGLQWARGIRQINAPCVRLCGNRPSFHYTPGLGQIRPGCSTSTLRRRSVLAPFVCWNVKWKCFSISLSLPFSFTIFCSVFVVMGIQLFVVAEVCTSYLVFMQIVSECLPYCPACKWVINDNLCFSPNVFVSCKILTMWVLVMQGKSSWAQ